ncbi:MAG: DHH family phosphoesterase, partial [Eubacterium sp.]|nr:DHH family phosphoesterase [Eubacterium sp.]
DRRISRYFSGEDILIKRFEHDKYMILFKQSQLNRFIENKFAILQSIKEVKVGTATGVTLSIGVGASGKNYNENYEFARTAVDMALGRGGDQAVVKRNHEMDYFAGSTKQIERQTTRVKARMKAQALYEIMTVSDEILIMGHHIGDVDSFGASIGIYRAAMTLGKRAHIVIDQLTSSIKVIKAMFTPEHGYPEDMFFTPQEAADFCGKDTMVMVVDVNRPSYTECPQLLDISERIVVFDHHRHGSDTIENTVLSYVEPYASSTCEMVTEVLQYFSDKVNITDSEADSIYAGIIIDTNNFMTKTGVRTFEAAAYLRRSGADVTRVRKMLQNDMEAYKARAEAVRRAEVYRGCFAMTECPTNNVESPTVAGAQAANELLNIIGIKASFVFTNVNGVVYISSRSIDEIDVQNVMSCIGGGGHMNVAGAQMTEVGVEAAMQSVKDILDEMIEKGDIII